MKEIIIKGKGRPTTTYSLISLTVVSLIGVDNISFKLLDISILSIINYIVKLILNTLFFSNNNLFTIKILYLY